MTTQKQRIPALRFTGFSAEWEEHRLDEVASIARGKFSIRPRNDPAYFGGNVPFVQTGDVVSAKRRLTSFSQTLNEKGLAVSKSFPKDTILMTIAANIGDVAITNFEVACPDSVVAINTKNNHDTEFLFYVLGTKKRELESVATTNAQANINLQILNPLKIVIPRLQEQQKIASFLSSVDTKIEQLTKQKAKLGQYKKGMMQKLFSQEIRFKNEEGEEYPDWGEFEFEDLYNFKPTNSYSRDNLNYDAGSVFNIHYGDIHTKFRMMFDINNEYVPYINLNVDLTRVHDEKFCREGDLVIADASEDYDDIGKAIELINLDGKMVLAGLHTLLARLNSKQVRVGFGGYLFSSSSVRKQIKVIAQGTKVLGLSASRVNKIKVSVPSTDEQKKITIFLSAIDEKIERTGKELENTQTFKKGLLQNMFV